MGHLMRSATWSGTLTAFVFPFKVEDLAYLAQGVISDAVYVIGQFRLTALASMQLNSSLTLSVG